MSSRPSTCKIARNYDPRVVASIANRRIGHACERALSGLGWNPSIEDIELLGGIDPQINLRAGNAAMAEPQRNPPDIARRLKRVDRAGMPKDMGRHLLAGQGWRRTLRGPDVRGKTTGKAVPAHLLAASVQEHRLVLGGGPYPQPVSKDGPCFLPQRQHALAAALAQNMDRIHEK